MIIFAIIDVISYVVLPMNLIDQSFFYCFMAGWTVSFMSPAIAVQHEWTHRKKDIVMPLLINLVGLLRWSTIVMDHHISIHHRYANTAKDNAHAFKNSNFLIYFYNYMIKPYYMLFKENKKRLFLVIFMSLFCSTILFKLFGLTALFYQIGSIFAFYYTVSCGNYINHYGLETLPISDKEKMKYSWDDHGDLGKYFAFNLQAHADHHSYSNKSFDKLNHIKGMPVYPYGFAIMIAIAPFPIFKKIMNKRLEDYCEKIKK